MSLAQKFGALTALPVLLIIFCSIYTCSSFHNIEQRANQIFALRSLIDKEHELARLLAYIPSLHHNRFDRDYRQALDGALTDAGTLANQIIAAESTISGAAVAESDRNSLSSVCRQLQIECASVGESECVQLIDKVVSALDELEPRHKTRLTSLLELEQNQKQLLNMVIPAEGLALFLCSLLTFTAARKWFYKPLLELNKIITTLAAGNDTATNCADTATIAERLRSISADVAQARMKEQAVLQNAVDVICLIDSEGRFVTINSASENLLGFHPDKLLNKSLVDFILPEDVASSLAAVIGAEKSIDKIVFETKWRHPGQGIIHLLWSAHWSAKDHGLFCVVHDITDRKIAEQLLQQSEERIRTILANLPVAIFTLTNVGKIDFVNRSAEELTGYNAVELIGRELWTVVPDKLQKNDTESLAKFMANADHNVTETCILAKSGQSIPSELVVGRSNLSEDGGYLLAALDISERHEIERMKREFVAMISHDLKTPLSSINVILSVIANAATSRLNDTENELLRQGQKEIARLVKLVTDLLDIEKMASGKFVMEKSPVSIRPLIVSAAEAIRPLALQRKITIEISDSDFTGIADGGRLVQVVANLLSNAVKFSKAGSTIKIALEQLENELIRVAISDNAPCIPAENRAVIFERYAQLRMDDSVRKGGHGLGLAICKTIVEEHGGEIGISNAADLQGNTFWFTVPMRPDPSNAQ